MTASRAGSAAPMLVLGIGNPLRCDDGIGPTVADACVRQVGPECDVVQLDGEATRVIEAWRDRQLAIVVDAVCLGRPAGTMHDLVLDAATIEQLQRQAEAGSVSSHYAGIAEAISLGIALDRMPQSMRIIGIEPANLDYGTTFSPNVASAIGPTIEHVLGVVHGWHSQPLPVECARP